MATVFAARIVSAPQYARGQRRGAVRLQARGRPFRYGRTGLYDAGMQVTRTPSWRPACVWPRGPAYPVSVALTANRPRARVQSPGRASGCARDALRARLR